MGEREWSRKRQQWSGGMRGGKNDTMSGGAKMERKRRPTAELRRRGRGTRESKQIST